MNRIAESELIINDRGAIYHQDLRPEELADLIDTNYEGAMAMSLTPCGAHGELCTPNHIGILLPTVADMAANSPFRALRSDKGEHMVLDENFFVEIVLPGGIIRKLSKRCRPKCGSLTTGCALR